MPVDIFNANNIDKSCDTDINLNFKLLQKLIRTGDPSALYFANTLIRKNSNEVVFKILRSQLILSNKNKTQETNLKQGNTTRYFYDARGNKS